MDEQTHQPIFHAVSKYIILIVCLITLTSISAMLMPQLYAYLEFQPANFSFSSSYRLISYGFIHQDQMHLAVNMLWLLIFATPIVRFFSVRSFMIIFILGLIAGSGIFLTGTQENMTLIGASAGVSACIGAALRFMLKPAYDFLKRPMLYALTDGRFLLPAAIFCVIDIGQAFFMRFMGENIAWQSHLIGFIMGALLMQLPFINKGAMIRNKLTASEETYLGD